MLIAAAIGGYLYGKFIVPNRICDDNISANSFIHFFVIGLFGFGGGYGMLSLIQTETVMHHIGCRLPNLPTLWLYRK